MSDIVVEKLNHLRYLAPFAMEIGLRFMHDAGLDPVVSRKIHELAAELISAAQFADDEKRLRAAFDALPHGDQAALWQLLAETSLLQQYGLPPDAVQELDNAFTYHWPTSFRFASAEEARAVLGPDATGKIDAFVATKAEGFWKRDALAEAANDLPFSDHNMKLVAAFGGALMDRPMEAVGRFVDAELLRADLARGALRLPPATVARLESGLNARRKSLRPDWPSVRLDEWLT